MKKRNFKLTVLIVLSLAGAGVIAQSVHEAIPASNGNGEAMEHNLNFPNAVTPADDNIQDFERCNGIVASSHPKENLSNKFNSKNYLKEKN